jgi:hypothetical protein
VYISKRVMPRQRLSRAAPKVLEEIGAFFILVLTFGTLALFISPSIGLLIWVGGLLITYLIYQAHKASREAYLRSQQTLNQLRAMSPSEFEEFLAWLFRKQGYDVKMTVRKGDHGVDLILYKGEGLMVYKPSDLGRSKMWASQCCGNFMAHLKTSAFKRGSL